VTAATLTGLLGDEDRLRVVAAIALGARTIDDVAKTGGLAPGEVRRALPRLIAAGVVEIEMGCASTSLRFGTRLATGLLDVVSFPARLPSGRVSCGISSRTAA
jgi:predicted transcriptional regulator